MNNRFLLHTFLLGISVFSFVSPLSQNFSTSVNEHEKPLPNDVGIHSSQPNYKVASEEENIDSFDVNPKD